MVNIDLFPDGILGNDNAVELLALSSTDANNYYLCGSYGCLRLRGTVLAGEFSVFYQEIDGVILASDFGSVTLFDGSTNPWTVVDTVSWDTVSPDHCFARVYDGASAWQEKRWPTMGYGNSSWATTPTPTVTPTP